MQGVTHLITGIFLQETTNKLRPAFLRYFLIALLAIISHGLLDKLGILTYHPPMPLIYDWFWLVYHFLLVWPITLYILIKYVRHYWFVFLFSVLPDFDWLISSLVKFFSLSFPFGQEAILHSFLLRFLNFFWPLRLLDDLPNWRLKRESALLELGLLMILIFLIVYLRKKKKNTPSP